MHGHFVHEQNGTALVVEHVVHKGSKGRALHAIPSRQGTQGARRAHARDGAGLFVDIQANVGRCDGAFIVGGARSVGGRRCGGCFAIDGHGRWRDARSKGGR